LSQEDSPSRYITVFGGSQADSGGTLYSQAYDLGRNLAQAGFDVISGGYGGTMEAVSRGAREAGAKAVGITLATFDERGLRGNRWLSAEHKAENYLTRLAELTMRASGFVALTGGIGTLSEVSITLSLLQIGEIAGKPLVLLGGCWEPYLDALREQFLMRSGDLTHVHLAPDAPQAVAWLRANVR
jgi:uncharacterized protein (TIGR00730 family)